MAKLPEKTKQIAKVHAQLINSVVMACHNKAMIAQLEVVLKSSEKNGWFDLVKRIRKILSGSRHTKLLVGLDEEDAAIILAILVGLQDANALPKLEQKKEGIFAAPGLAKMIYAASNGDVSALSSLSDMATQLTAMPGDMRKLGVVLQPMINGERDLTILTQSMSEESRQLVENILLELEKIDDK